jgi:hypothetical protein
MPGPAQYPRLLSDADISLLCQGLELYRAKLRSNPPRGARPSEIAQELLAVERLEQRVRSG